MKHNIISKTLDNKLKSLIIPIKGTDAMTILVLFGTGSKYENKRNNGISHFLEHMFFKGTEKRPNTLDISSELDGVGGDFNAFTGKECTGYWVKVAGNKKELAADIVSDMLMNSKFDKGEIEREKGVIIEEINMYHNNPMMYIDEVMEDCLYGDTPAGREIVGPIENIKRFRRDDFVDYFNTQYSASNAVVCMAGNITGEEGGDMAKRFFSGIREVLPQKKKKTDDRQSAPAEKVAYKDTKQVNLSFAVRSVPIDHKDEMTVRLIASILGGSMSSRLFIRLREREGLAYYVRSSPSFYTDSGYLATEAGVPIKETKRAVKLIWDEYQRMANETVGGKELKKVKEMIKGKTILSFESSDNVALWYGRQFIFRKEMVNLSDHLKAIDKIDPIEIKRVSKKIFKKEKANLALIGPFKKKKGFLDII